MKITSQRKGQALLNKKTLVAKFPKIGILNMTSSTSYLIPRQRQMIKTK